MNQKVMYGLKYHCFEEHNIFYTFVSMIRAPPGRGAPGQMLRPLHLHESSG